MAVDGQASRLDGLVDLAWTAVRFVVVGLANTAVGFGVIMVLQFGLRVPPALANTGGYALGFVVSFTLNRRFTFADNGRLGPTAVRFIIAALASFALNQVVLFLAGHALGRAGAAPVLAQAAAAVSYTVTLFILCRLWVFRNKASR